MEWYLKCVIDTNMNDLYAEIEGENLPQFKHLNIFGSIDVHVHGVVPKQGTLSSASARDHVHDDIDDHSYGMFTP